MAYQQLIILQIYEYQTIIEFINNLFITGYENNFSLISLLINACFSINFFMKTSC